MDHENEFIRYLSEIINDRSIPEERKVMVRKQLDEIIRLKIITMKPTIIIEAGGEVKIIPESS